MNPLANNFVTVFVRNAIDQRVNPLELIKAAQLQLMIPVAASNGSVKAHVKDVRAEIVDGTLRCISYEFNGTKVNNLKDSRSIKTLPPGFRAKSGKATSSQQAAQLCYSTLYF